MRVKIVKFNKNVFLRDLEYLVNIDSGTRTAEGVAKVADYLIKKYEAAGLTVKRYVFDPLLGPCVEARNHPECDDIDLLLIGHMDTVFPPGTAAARPYREEDGKAYGPGVADMKSGDLLALALVEELQEAGVDLNICIANNPDEEIGSPSADAWLLDLGKKSKFCFDFEPGRAGGDFVKTRKGVQHLTIQMEGIAAHAGVNPDAGASAILEMSRWACHVADMKDELGGTYVNFGVVKGGTVYNMVPNYCECGVDLRFDTMEALEKIHNELYRMAENPYDSRIKVKIDSNGCTPPMITNENSLKLMDLMKEEGKKLGQTFDFIGTGGGSDASRISAAGAATMDACGPVGYHTHNEGEYIVLSSIEERLQILFNVCVRLWGNQ